MRRVILLVMLLAAATAVSAQAYKWKDADGRIQYSDTPPPTGTKDVQQLRKATGATTAAPTTSPAAVTPPKVVADPDADFRKRQMAQREADAKQAKAQEDEQVRTRHCEQARSHLAALESGGRLTRYNDKGERVVLDDAGRDEARAEAQKAIATWCK